MPFVGRQTARGYGCRNGAAAGQLDRLKLLDLVKVFGQTRSKRRKRMRMRIELVSRLGGMDHGADAGIGQQLQEQRMRRGTVNDVARNTPPVSASTAARSLGIMPLSTSPP